MFDLYLVAAVTAVFIFAFVLLVCLSYVLRALQKPRVRGKVSYTHAQTKWGDSAQRVTQQHKSYSSPATHQTQPQQVQQATSYQKSTTQKSYNLFKLQGQLLNLVGGDRETAQRLLTGAKVMYPEKADGWYFEKVIYDLERDRRS